MTPSRIGYHAAVITSLLTLITFGIAIATPPLSGPLCQAGCFQYPYAETVSRFPRDYLWMYPALFLYLAYLVLMVCIHQSTKAEKKLFSHIGLCLALIASGTLLLTYYVQLAVIQPSLLQGETDGLALLSQYNPHGLFIALEEFGYLAMSLSFLALVPVYFHQSKSGKVLAWIFLINMLLSIASLILVSVLYGLHREYRFEIAIISFNWCTTIAAGFLLANIFKAQLSRSFDS